MKNIHKLILGLGTFILSLFLTQSAFAGNYGAAGCGLGAVITGPKGSQISAATTNLSFYSQAFGITSGISECTDSAVIKAEVEQKIFVHRNYSILEKEVSQGQGDSITSLAYLMGCSTDTVSDFGRAMQSNYQFIFDANHTKDVNLLLDRVKDVASSKQSLNSNCSRIFR